MKKTICTTLTVLFLGLSTMMAQGLYVIKKGSPVAFSEANYNKMMDGIANSDTDYLQTLIDNQQMIVAGKDIEVYLVDASFTGPTIVRMKGQDLKLYTTSISVKPK